MTLAKVTPHGAEGGEAPASAAGSDRTASVRARAFQTTLLLLPVLFIAIMGWQRRYLDDDAFFNFRVVDQIWAGHGPVFNAGQRVEMTTSSLWLVVLVLGHLLLPFAKLEWIALLAGIAFTCLGVWWAQLGAAKVWRRSTTATLVPLGTLIYVAVPVSWDRATSGLENGLSIGWLGAVMLVLGRELKRPAGKRWAWAVGLVLGLGPLVRPDLGLMALTSVIAVCAMRRRARSPSWPVVVGFLVLPVATEIFRMGYYGVLVPNTAIAKDSGGFYLDRGWSYLVDFVAPYLLWVPVLLAAVACVGAYRRRATNDALPALLALPIGAVLHLAYMTATGGDYLHGRLVHTTLFALLAPVAVIPWTRRTAVPWILAAAWALLAAFALRPALMGIEISPRTSPYVLDGRELMRAVTKPGRDPILATDFALKGGLTAKRLAAAHEHAYVTSTAPKPLLGATRGRTQLLAGGAGVNGYLAGPDVIVQEWHGLADVVTSRFPAGERFLAGHRKGQEPEWFVAMATKPGITSGLSPQKVNAARQALRCGEIRDLIASTEDPLTPGRFLSNLWGAFGRTSVEIPRDPASAVRKFCS